jgi:diadenosine tetraphosphate (Ap4A) HIT family hydrolase
MADPNDCPFCQCNADMKDRMFYERLNWFAILAAPPNMSGHVVLAVKGSDACPRAPTAEVLRGIDVALADVMRILQVHHHPKHILLSSLRVQDPHFHLHLFPVSEDAEQRWREGKGPEYKSGHFHEFLGDHERDAFRDLALERQTNGWSATEQRLAHTLKLVPHAAELRRCWRQINSADPHV